MQLASILSKEAVLPRLGSATKKQALKAIAAQAESITGLEAADVFDGLMDREHASCTGVGGGVAIPQARFEGLKKTCAVFATLSHAVEFGAADGKPVDLLFALLVPKSAPTDQVKSMALASKLLRDKKLCQALRLTSDAAAMHALLTATDENI